LLPSATADPVAAEAALVSNSVVNGATTTSGRTPAFGGTTTLTLLNPLQRIYDTPTVNVNANAVQATHGETVMEIMGSGDAADAALEFQLKQSPLTYTAAAANGGVQSTLQVRVNNLLWTEAPNFLSSGPADRVYVTTPVPNAGPMVQFGDGIRGSRTATGVSNIQARYRKGIGVAGMVAAGQLTIPLDRLQGVQTVTNPSPATGGADPTAPADAKTFAPLPTLTLGRIVSLEDYQNFALNFAGIALALATWTWFGATRGVFLTLAGEGGTTLDASDQTVVYLMQAYRQFGLPNMPVLPVSYVPQNFEIGMQVMVDAPTYAPNLVLAQVWQSLSTAFAFGQLAPGQGVAASQAIRIAQTVPGVTAVNLTAFNLSGDATGVGNMLCASGPVPASNGAPPAGAQVLLLDPACQGNVVAWS
jgi:predicted phage baseplate assembly protein